MKNSLASEIKSIAMELGKIGSDKKNMRAAGGQRVVHWNKLAGIVTLAMGLKDKQSLKILNYDANSLLRDAKSVAKELQSTYSSFDMADVVVYQVFGGMYIRVDIYVPREITKDQINEVLKKHGYPTVS